MSVQRRGRQEGHHIIARSGACAWCSRTGRNGENTWLSLLSCLISSSRAHKPSQAFDWHPACWRAGSILVPLCRPLCTLPVYLRRAPSSPFGFEVAWLMQTTTKRCSCGTRGVSSPRSLARLVLPPSAPSHAEAGSAACASRMANSGLVDDAAWRFGGGAARHGPPGAAGLLARVAERPRQS